MVSGCCGAFTEDLVLPLASGNFCVDSFDVDTRFQAHVQVLFNQLTTVSILGAYRAVVGALRFGVSVFWETGWAVGFCIPQEVLLLEAEPEISIIIVDRRTTVGRVWRPIGIENFTHHQVSTQSTGIREDGNGLEQTVRGTTLGLLSRATVKAPFRAIFQFATEVTHDFGLAAKALSGREAIKPNVFQFEFTHRYRTLLNNLSKLQW